VRSCQSLSHARRLLRSRNACLQRNHSADGGRCELAQTIAMNSKEASLLLVPHVTAHGGNSLLQYVLAANGQSMISGCLREPDKALLRKQQVPGVSRNIDVSIPRTIGFSRRTPRVRDQLQRIQIDLIVVRLIARMLNDAIVDTDSYQTHSIQIALTPVPVVKSLKRRERLANKFKIAIAPVDALHAPGQQRRLRVRRKREPVLPGKPCGPLSGAMKLAIMPCAYRAWRGSSLLELQ